MCGILHFRDDEPSGSRLAPVRPQEPGVPHPFAVREAMGTQELSLRAVRRQTSKAIAPTTTIPMRGVHETMNIPIITKR